MKKRRSSSSSEAVGHKSRLLASILLAGGALLAGAVLYPMRAEQTSFAVGRGAQPSDDSAVLTPSGSSTIEAIAALQAQLAERPRDARLNAQLASALLQQARDTATPRHLDEAETALQASLAAQPRANVAAFVGMAALANARHDFSSSVRWSQRAIAANPAGASAYGLLGDALFELGRVRASERAYQAMVDRRPDTASYIRASYALQHQGRTGAAIKALRLALQAAGPSGETAAFVWHQLGDIYAGQGRHAAAERANRAGVNMAPGFVPPTVGVAESYLARGRVDRAIPLLEQAVQTLPALEYFGTLGDAYSAADRDADAAAAYRQGAAALREYRRHGVQPDADFIVFYADHGVRPGAALREARQIYRNRPTVKTADALAWMLHAVGRDGAARRYARQAINDPSASSAEFFHAAQIELALGHRAAGARLLRTALELDPMFSITDAPAARRQLEAIS